MKEGGSGAGKRDPPPPANGRFAVACLLAIQDGSSKNRSAQVAHICATSILSFLRRVVFCTFLLYGSQCNGNVDYVDKLFSSFSCFPVNGACSLSRNPS